MRSGPGTALRATAVVGLLLLVTMLRATTVETGFGFGFLQVFPIVLTAFWFGRRAAFLVAGAAVLLIVGSDLLPVTPDREPALLWGGAVVRGVVFLGIAAVVGSLLRRERRADRAFRLLADNAEDLIARGGTDGIWRYLSPSAQRILGVDPERLVGRNALELVHPDDLPAARAALAGVTDGPTRTRVRLRRADGSYVWVESRARVVPDPDTGEPELHAVARVVDDEVHLQQELERFRAIAERSSDAVAVTDPDGRLRYLNPVGLALLGPGPEGRFLQDQLPPAGRRVAAQALAAAEAEGAASGDVVVTDLTGAPVPVRFELVAHRDQRGALAYLTTVAHDLRAAQEAEETRRHVAVGQAARDASEATAARLRALVEGLGAAVWERDVATGRVELVTERIVDLLGYPVRQWRAEPDLWGRVLHPVDRERVQREFAARTAAGEDFAAVYRMVAADGRVRWVHDIEHVTRTADGSPGRVQGVLVDVTAERRREGSAVLLAEAGRRLAEPGAAAQRLTAVAELAVGDLADLVLVRVRGDDGRYRAVAAAPAAVAAAVLDLPPVRVPEPELARFREGRAFAIPERGDETLLSGFGGPEASAAARAVLGHGSSLVVPLLVDGRDVGVLSLVSHGPREYDGPDVELGEQLGQRVAAIVTAERVATRQRQLQRVTEALSRADTLDEVAEAVETGVSAALGASAQSLFVVEPEQGGLRQVRTAGYPTAITDRFVTIALDEQVPIADCARTGEPVWLPDRAAWLAGYPHFVEHLDTTGNTAAAALPLLVADRVVGTLAASFPTPRDFPPDERAFALALAGQAAQALQRAGDADRRRGIADTLQRSLLPGALPDLDRLLLAAHYLPATRGTQAGGDWYDVLPLPDGRVAIAVGDVVGHGPPAAAVMGQLRSALAAYLLDGHGPADALTRLDAFAARIPAARASTALCVLLDPADGRLRWARAGHLPPLLVSGDGAVVHLDDPSGCLLGLVPRRPVVERSTVVDPGTTLVLYTDGLVERRGETLDDGLDRLARAVRLRAGAAPADLLPAALDGALGGRDPDDDVALVVVRLLPGPLELRVPATADQLRPVRAAVVGWAAAAAVTAEPLDDLELAVGEAVTNSIEHAFPPGRSGEVVCRVERGAADVRVEVCDTGTWRPEPADAGHRGRGLDLIRAVAPGAVVDTDGPGTTVRFAVPVPPAPAGALPPSRPAGGSRVPAAIHASGHVLHLRGDLDAAAVDTVGPDLEARLRDLDGAAVLDLDGLTHLGSAGIRLLVGAAGRVTLRCTPGTVAARALTAAGLDDPRAADHGDGPVQLRRCGSPGGG